MRQEPLLLAEQLALLALAAFLPAFEAPKNIAMALYLVLWAINRWRSGDWGGKWSGWDSLAVLLIAGAFASAQFGAFPPNKGLASANDVLSYGLVFMALRRSHYPDQIVWRLLAVTIVATLATLAYGYWGLWVTKERQTLGLHSVGHVNHSAIYLGIVFSVALAWTFSVARGALARVLAGAAALILWVSLFVTQARGALIPAVVFVVAWFALRANSARDLIKPLVALVAVVACVVVFVPGVLQKTKAGAESGQLGSYRPALAKTAMLAFREYPLFGVGITSFGKIAPEKAEAWQQHSGRLFGAEGLYFNSHAHSLYFNTLAERGLVGMLPMLILLAGVGIALVRRRPSSGAGGLEQTLWGGALGAWVITVVGGVFNTTLHHEHAMIFAILVGLWMARLAKGGR